MWPESEQKLGGGLVLLASGREPYPLESDFCLYKAYSLADRAFCVEPGLVYDALSLIGLGRLGRIYQLQNLTVAEIGAKLRNLDWPHHFLHTRLTHSLRAGALHGIMAEPCGLSEEERVVGVLGDSGHDMFTCAGGDSWKDVTHQKTLFDEDDKFAEKIFRYYDSGWRELCRKYGFDPEKTALEIQDIVDGKGLRGQIHEVADTASYMLGDLAEIKKAYARVGGQKFHEIISASEDDWDVWNHIKVENDQLVVTDPLVLENFLRLRVLLWANLYQNPAAKFLELLAREIVYPYLINHNLINLAELPIQRDPWLYSLVEREMGLASGTWNRLDLLGTFPRCISFLTWGQAMDFEDHLHALNDFTLVFSVKDFQETKSKTGKYLIKGLDGNLATFKEARPTDAEKIEDIAWKSTSPAEPVQVCWVEKPAIPNTLRAAWEEARARWQERK